MDNYLVMIGLEMHCEISETNSKVFSSARNEYTSLANSNIQPIDMGFPGTLPVVNKKAVEYALMTSMILNCKQPEYMYFERKNYYYPDMPKNYQLTQETKPIPVGIYGKLEYECNGKKKIAIIDNLHLEEDAASSEHVGSVTYIDYNRACVPLLELVTPPCFHSAEEAVAFLETMRNIYQYAGISEADSKKGQIRCDVNVSIMDKDLDPNDPKNWGVKVEMKNVNTFSGVRDAINYEIERQVTAKEDGNYDETVIQETRRWDDESGTTIRMRSKVNAIDYNFFVEPNIPKYKITQEWLDEIRKKIPQLPNERKEKYVSEYGLSDYDASNLVKEKAVSDYFEECIKLGVNPKSASNWITTRILGYINKELISMEEVFITPNMLKDLIDMINSNKISSKQAKDVFYKALEEKKSPKDLVKELGMEQITDDTEIRTIFIGILDENEENIKKYKEGRTNVLDFFVGQVMKATRGKANPSMASSIILEEIEKR